MLRAEIWGDEDHASCTNVEGYTLNRVPQCEVDITSRGVEVTAIKDSRDRYSMLYALEYRKLSFGSVVREDWQKSNLIDRHTWNLALEDFETEVKYEFKCCVRTDKIEQSEEFKRRVYDDECTKELPPPIPDCPMNMRVVHEDKTTSKIPLEWTKQSGVTYRI